MPRSFLPSIAPTSQSRDHDTRKEAALSTSFTSLALSCALVETVTTSSPASRLHASATPFRLYHGSKGREFQEAQTLHAEDHSSSEYASSDAGPSAIDGCLAGYNGRDQRRSRADSDASCRQLHGETSSFVRG
jgi:hypothetical protein